MENLKEKLKAVREAVDLVQEDFAEEVGVGTSTIAKAESGVVPVSKGLVKKICERYGIDKSYFYGKGKLEITRLKTSRISGEDPWKDEAYLNLKETAKKWEEKYEKLWAKFEILLDRVQPSQPGKFKALNLAGGQKRSQLRATA